jgi:hypothetical protein
MAVYELVYISLQCNAIVNSTRGDLFLGQGAVSVTILAAAGKDIKYIYIQIILFSCSQC